MDYAILYLSLRIYGFNCRGESCEVVRTGDEYIFDYRLKNESDAIGKGNPAYCRGEIATDRYGVARLHPDGSIDIGAYTWVEAVEE